MYCKDRFMFLWFIHSIFFLFNRCRKTNNINFVLSSVCMVHVMTYGITIVLSVFTEFLFVCTGSDLCIFTNVNPVYSVICK